MVWSRVEQRVGKETLITAAVGDNAANMMSAALKLCKEGWGCVSHTIQLGVLEVFNKLPQLLADTIAIRVRSPDDRVGEPHTF